jgi:hypothetical protein
MVVLLKFAILNMWENLLYSGFWNPPVQPGTSFAFVALLYHPDVELFIAYIPVRCMYAYSQVHPSINTSKTQQT